MTVTLLRLVHMALAAALVFLVTSCSTIPARTTKVLFIAGPPSHGWGQHEHGAGCDLLAKALNDAGLNVNATVHKNGWPKDSAVFEGIDGLVMYCDGDQKHVAMGHEKELQALSDKGVGIACIHYAVASDTPELNKTMLDCLGGFFEVGWSVNPAWTLEAEKVKLGAHPITFGVTPFKMKDEWYYHMRFRKDMKGVTPILSTLPPANTLAEKDGPRCGNPALRKELKDGIYQHLAWASENNAGSRGFGFTGGHYNANWLDDNFRKLVLNGILWTAGRAIPDDGVESNKPLILKYKSILQAIGRNDADDVRRHLKSGVKVNGQNKSGWAPIHYAAARGNVAIAKILIAAGANINLQTKSGRTPLHDAASRNYIELAMLLINKGADLTVKEKGGWTPLHFAAEKDRIKIAKALIAKGAPINTLSIGGGTPLHEAAAAASPEMIKLLLKHGADPNIKAKNGKTAYDYAIELKNDKAAAILKQLTK